MTTHYLSYSEPFAVKNIEIFELDMEQHNDIKVVIRETGTVMPKVRIVAAQGQRPPAVSEALRWHLPTGETAVLQTTAIIDDAYCQSTAVVVQADGSAKQVEHPVWQQSLLMAAGVAGLAGIAGVAGATALSGAGAPAPAAADGSGLNLGDAANTVGKAAKFVAGLFSDDDDEEEDGQEETEKKMKKKKRMKTKAEEEEEDGEIEADDNDENEEGGEEDSEEGNDDSEKEDDDDDFDLDF